MKYEILYQRNTKFSLQKVMVIQSFGSCPSCVSSVSVVTEMPFKHLNERALSFRELCTCEYLL